MDHDGHPASEDCDDRDPNVWQNLSYSFRDADGDEHTVAQAGTICSGASLPKGYSRVASDPDCDDTDPTAFTTLTGFLDIDGDGFGGGMAMTFARTATCRRATRRQAGTARRRILPPGRTWPTASATPTATGSRCRRAARSAPTGRCRRRSRRPSTATTATMTMRRSITSRCCTPDLDEDGVGALPRQITCIGTTVPAGLSRGGFDDDDTDPDVIEVDDEELDLLLLGD